MNKKLKISCKDAVDLDTFLAPAVAESGVLNGDISYWLGKLKGKIESIVKHHTKAKKAIFEELCEPADKDAPEIDDGRGNIIQAYKKGDMIVKRGEQKDKFDEKIKQAEETIEELTFRQFTLSELEYKNEQKKIVCILPPMAIELMGDLIKPPEEPKKKKSSN